MGNGGPTGSLVICPTPIGNLRDVTQRSLEALRSADVVCAEDTRVTGRLLAAYDIQKRLERLDEAAISKEADRILEHVRSGQRVVFCSDAGMPGVSDPGCRLVRAAQDAGLPVEVLPGPSAGVTAYVASGFTNPCFYFGGFFPRKAQDRSRLLEGLKALDAVLVFYESPARLVSSLQAAAESLPEREVAVCRELTKLHEEVYRGPAAQVRDEFAARAQKEGVKGEVVLVIDGPCAAEWDQERAAALVAARELAVRLRAGQAGEAAGAGEVDHAAGTPSSKDLAARLQEEFGISRNDAYEIALGR
ncbi:MAG: 16S rRNA (cytidine(1402)-2'-O)-methyltransferase [Eggerthellaceae bacterium]|nr:16S rRNA (cytidine(1402)-2'-O)-methyltransferase [Eggerthellaceae bacterium]